jgi:TetR/AcrR family fatty acid metabolism transcriptional regulator
MNAHSSQAGGEPAPRAPSPTELVRRQQIIDATLAVLAEEGYRSASVARIARRAGVATGSVPYYFGSKDGLFEAAVRAVFERGGAFMAERIEAAASPPAILRCYIESNLAFMAAHTVDVLATAELARHHTFGDAPHLAQGEEAVVSVLASILEQGQRSGDFRAFDARVMAHAIRHAIDGVPTRLRRERDLDLTAIGLELADLFDAATRAAGPSQPH